MSWVRETRVVEVADLPADVAAAAERGARGMGIDWPARLELAWRTTSTTEVGRFKKRTRIVVVHGCLGPDVIGWAVSDDGGAPGAMVVRRARVDVFPGSGLRPEVAALATEVDQDGVSIRGDLGYREVSTYFMGLGDGPDADRVRTALVG